MSLLSEQEEQEIFRKAKNCAIRAIILFALMVLLLNIDTEFWPFWFNNIVALMLLLAGVSEVRDLEHQLQKVGI